MKRAIIPILALPFIAAGVLFQFALHGFEVGRELCNALFAD